MPDALREFMAEIGRKGGSRKTEAQSYALAKGANASRAVHSAQSIERKAQIQALKRGRIHAEADCRKIKFKR